MRNRWVALLAVAAAVVLSAGVASALTFNDVPPGHPGEAGIGYVSDVGISEGCGDGNFCPDSAVSRSQMATFLHRMSGWATGVAPSVNAATLDGHTADELLAAAGEPGPQGPAGPSGLSGYEVVEEVVEVVVSTNDDVIEVVAECPAGKVAFGGGAVSEDTRALDVRGGGPTAGGAGWSTILRNERTPVLTLDVTVWAVCATATP